MSLLPREQAYDILRGIAEAGSLGDMLDLLGAEIRAIGAADGFLINLLNAAGTHLVSQKISYMPEFQDLEQTYLGFQMPLTDGHLNSRAFNQRSVVRINAGNATEEESHVLRYWKVEEVVAIPILDTGKPDCAPIGVVVLLKQKDPVDDVALETLRALLTLFYKSLANWLRFSQIEEMHHEAQAAVAENKRLLQFLDDMNSLTSVEKIYELFAAELFRQLPFDIAAFSLMENEKLVPFKVAVASPVFHQVGQEWRHFLEQNPYPLDPTISGAVYVLLRNEHMMFPDLQKIMHLSMTEHDKQSLAILKTARTLFISPVRYQKKAIGIFALYSLAKPITLSEADLHLLAHLSSFLGTAITNSRIYAKSQTQNLEIGHLNLMLQEKIKELAEQASTDQLTGLFNFRTFEQELGKRLTEAQRESSKSELSLALIDIDHFKHFNDTHGHAAGNDVLAGIAREIGQQIRQTDMACRYGGEEFVVILPKCDLEGARLLAERIRSGIESARFDTCAGRQSVTVSIGCTTHQPGDSRQSLFTRADEALYKAKHNGRNQVCTL